MTLVWQNNDGAVTGYFYDDLGRPTAIGRSQEATTHYAYDGASRLSNLWHTGTSQDVAYTFSYNPAGQVIGQTRDNDAYAWTQHWNQDLAYGIDGKNRITSITGLSAPTYDGQGNMTSDGTRTFGYDLLGRLTDYASGTGSLAYDPGGRLYETKPPSAAITRFIYDGLQAAAELDATGAIIRRYVPGARLEEPAVSYIGSGTSGRQWLLADRLGSVVASVDDAAAVTRINAYDEYGAPNSGNVGRFGYTGQMWLPEAGIYHYRARAYQPVLGRFLQPDPLGYGDGLNVYAYVGNDPVNLTDPLGLALIPGSKVWRETCISERGKVRTRATEQVVCVAPPIFSQSLAGMGGGMMWRAGNGGGSRPAPTPEQRRRRRRECIQQCVRILERPQPPWSDRNQWDFHKCVNACMADNPEGSSNPMRQHSPWMLGGAIIGGVVVIGAIILAPEIAIPTLVVGGLSSQ
jgi:RHS repeat-associated protein